jgi:hypothetical protein
MEADTTNPVGDITRNIGENTNRIGVITKKIGGYRAWGASTNSLD